MGKKLRMPDGVLLNAKDPYKYNSSVLMELITRPLTLNLVLRVLYHFSHDTDDFFHVTFSLWGKSFDQIHINYSMVIFF